MSRFDDITGEMISQARMLELQDNKASRVEVGSIARLEQELIDMRRVAVGIRNVTPSFMGLKIVERADLPEDIVELVAADGKRQRFQL